MNHNKLPADPLALILGIIALVIGIAGCCCYGITAIIPLIIAIIGLVTANKSLKAYGQNPEAYYPQTRSNVSTAKIINIIAIVMNGLVLLFAIAAIVFYGTMLSSGMLDDFNIDTIEDDDFFDTEIELDTTNTWEEDTYIIEESNDSIETDSKQEKSFEDTMKDFDSKY
ncbi:CCC motif membrane protein [Winogradskyella sp. PG-2]|uniref:CCC motif membrane protein n=1 Tax=Winogradskyella sp. PG-2 TaxID=754409 RepID=UPI000458909B|nr:CCC motif membrane protein [Winogradskyella sp. PG-2]BAO75827.1 hypothetical protein WPG_1597 [Winogradskyella sp. PG-2]